MIIVAAAVVAIALALLTGGDVRRLVELPFRHVWLVWAAIAIQVGVLSLLADHVDGPVGDTIHLCTYALAVAFVLVNWRVPGVPLMALGGGLNLTAILANGGIMPASAAAWRLAGHGAASGFENSLPLADPRVAVLGDVFAVPAGWPLANVFSIGDLVLVAGLVWMVLRGCRPRIAPAVPLPSITT